MRTGVMIAAGALLAACASSPPPPPRTTSAAQHDALAAREDARARRDESEHEQLAMELRRCDALLVPGDADAPCWTELRRRSAEYALEAEEHRARAADHRVASRALRDAEARACEGVAPIDRDVSPFHHREDVASVAPLVVESRVVGATIVFRALPGMTAGWLERVIDCHLARNAALGHRVPEMPYCPLVPPGVHARVAGTAEGIAVSVWADDAASAAEVLRRARALR